MPGDLESQRAELENQNLAIPVLEEANGQFDVWRLTCAFPVLPIIVLGVLPIAGAEFYDGQFIGQTEERATAILEPFADQSVVFQLAGPGAVWTEIEVLATECDDGLAACPMLAVLGEMVVRPWHGAALLSFWPKTVCTVFEP